MPTDAADTKHLFGASTPTEAGLTVLVLIGAIVLAYFVRQIVPSNHYPRTAGYLAANAMIAILTLAGVEAAVRLLIPFVGMSSFLWVLACLGPDSHSAGSHF